MLGERMLSSSNETVDNSSETSELSRQTTQAIGKAAIRNALIDSMPPVSSSGREKSPLSADKKAKFEAYVKMQQQEIAAEGGKNVNDSILDRAENVPDAYSQSELISAKIATSADAIIAALSVSGQNRQLIEMLKSALGGLKASGAEELLKYDPTTKRLSSIEKPATSPAPAAKIINFPTPNSPTQSEDSPTQPETA